MAREVTLHEATGLPPTGLKIEAFEKGDEPGGACHSYLISGFDTATNRAMNYSMPEHTQMSGNGGVAIVFQYGTIPEVGVNGVTLEALLAVCADRLRGFQAGPYPCRQNELALGKIEEAMHWLNHRTAERIKRNVEGKHAK